jgi:hypothetical protein
MKINVSTQLFAQLEKLKNIQNNIKEDVIKPSGESALVDVKHIIATDEMANATGKTGNKTPYDPIAGRRTQPDTMYSEVGIKETSNGVDVGWENPSDYYEAQNLGWGSGGNANQPQNALYENVKGAYFMEAGYESAKQEVKKKIIELVAENK